MNKKLHIIFTKGLQASGKSTWAKQFVKDNQNYKRVCRDDLRHMLSTYTFNDENEKLVTALENHAIYHFICKGYNLIIDKMNLNSKQLEKDIEYIKSIFDDFKTEIELDKIEIKEFPITLEEAIERDKKRDFVIGEKVIKNTWRKYEISLKQMLERSKPKYPWNSNLPYCVICDIDGTLAHSPNRKIFDFKEVINDELIIPVWSILDKYKSVCDIILLSGRGEDCRKETEEWLLAKHVPYTTLYMRKEKDFRKDDEVKLEIFNLYIKNIYQPIFIIDDRISVLKMWQNLGLFTLDVRQDAEGKNYY